VKRDSGTGMQTVYNTTIFQFLALAMPYTPAYTSWKATFNKNYFWMDSPSQSLYAYEVERNIYYMVLFVESMNE